MNIPRTQCLNPPGMNPKLAPTMPQLRDYVRGGSEGALAPPEFGGSERRTERETDNLLLLAPPESKS